MNKPVRAPLELELSEETQAALDELAAARNETPEATASALLAARIKWESRYLAAVREGIADADAGRTMGLEEAWSELDAYMDERERPAVE
jgi:predicted transcriptional regulator